MKVLKKNGHFAHVLNQGWLPKVGVYADGPVEMLCVLKGYAAAFWCHDSSLMHSCWQLPKLMTLMFIRMLISNS